MKDLTHGSIVRHILVMTPPIMAGMISIMVCQLVDLYFVSGLGDAAVAGVAAAGTAGFLVNALIQVLGVAGSGLATSIAVAIGTLMLLAHFRKVERYVAFNPAQWRPQPRHLMRILNVGLPAGGEFVMMFIFMGVVYYVLRDFGAAAQAGFGIGQRMLGLIQMPALAVALAAGPIAGQNVGAGNGARVRETFVKSALIATSVMIAFMILAQWKPGLLLD